MDIIELKIPPELKFRNRIHYHEKGSKINDYYGFLELEKYMIESGLIKDGGWFGIRPHYETLKKIIKGINVNDPEEGLVKLTFKMGGLNDWCIKRRKIK